MATWLVSKIHLHISKSELIVENTKVLLLREDKWDDSTSHDNEEVLYGQTQFKPLYTQYS